jgi:hypothetical protein
MVRNIASPAFRVVAVDDIAERAYEIYADRGRADGFDRDDWLRAERELSALRTIAPKGVSTNLKKTVRRLQL